LIKKDRRKVGDAAQEARREDGAQESKEDFSLLTASTVGMDPRMLAAHNYYNVMILDEIDAKIVAVEAAAENPTSGGSGGTSRRVHNSVDQYTYIDNSRRVRDSVSQYTYVGNGIDIAITDGVARRHA
jgi:hypothetical protein